jgi:hypothetical protein
MHVRQHLVQQVGESLHLALRAARFPADRTRFRALELFRPERLEVSRRLARALHQLGQGLLVVLPGRRGDAREACGSHLHGVGRDLNLPRQREHVGREARADEDFRVDLARCGVLRRLLEHRGQVRHHPDPRRHCRVVHRDLHHRPRFASPRMRPL